MAKSKIYYVWKEMRARCNRTTHPKYKRYGGRGIQVCDRWKVFSNFKHDMGEAPFSGASLGRINNDGPYSPENCRWETPTQQVRNRSITRTYEVYGQSKTLAEWAKILGVRYETLKQWEHRHGTDSLLCRLEAGLDDKIQRAGGESS